MNKLSSGIAALAATLAMGATANAQSSVPTADDYKRFPDTKTLVVLDANLMSDFNSKIKQCMADEWKVTEYDLVPYNVYKERMGDPSYSFFTTTTVNYGKDKKKARYTYLSLLMGKEGAKKENVLPDLISIPLCYHATEDPHYEYKLQCFVRFILKHVDYMTRDPKKISDMPLMMYNKKNTKALANKTLYLVAEDLPKDLQSIEAIQQIYKNPVRLVEQSELEQAIAERRADVVFLHLVAPVKNTLGQRCFKMILGADDAEVYYFDHHELTKKEPNKLLAKDLKKMSK